LSYVAKLKAQSAGDVNRVLPALKDNATIETIENNLITSWFKVIINHKKPDTLYRVFYLEYFWSATYFFLIDSNLGSFHS
jgi:hypothetical protein